MWGKITQLPLMAYFAVTGFFSDLKNDERGLSGLVVTVILILIAVVIAFALRGQIMDLIDRIFTDIDTELDNF